MSALNGFVTANAVHMFTDGGQYDPETVKLSGVAPKVAILPQYNAAIGYTGHAFISQALPLFFSYGDGRKPEDEGDLIANFPDWVRTCIKQMAGIGGPSNWGRFEIVLATCSKDGPRAHVLRSDGRSDFSYQEATRFVVPRNSSVDAIAFDPANPTGSGIELMRVQRREKFGVESAVSNHRDALRNMMARPEDRTDAFQVVHGFCQYTRVDRDGIHTRILERWD